MDRDVVKKKVRTMLGLVLRLDIRGLLFRFRLLHAKYGNPGSLAKERFLARAREALDHFFFTGSRLGFDTSLDPDVTIVLILWNKAELTYQCLHSLTSLSSRQVKHEILIIDNASSDVTAKLIDRIDGARIVRNQENVGFLKACNQARDLVTSPFLLFLNNDTIVHQGAVEAAMARISQESDVGAVGARIILPSGKLQEAGNILWNDGTCQGYARGRPSNAPEALFSHYTDYCSGAFLLTRTALFRQFNGFDERYLPAYYEETDFCINLWRAGYKIVYEPRSTITHFEFGSAELSERSFALMNANRVKLLEKHKDFLATKPPPPQTKGESVIQYRIPRAVSGRGRILYIEDRVPNKFLGAGFPRSNDIVNKLCELGYEVTIFPAQLHETSLTDAYSDIDPRAEIVRGVGLEKLPGFLRDRGGFYQALWICRPDNLDYIMRRKDQVFGDQRIPVIYDGEAIFSDREKAYFAVKNQHTASRWTTNEMEFALAKQADVIVAVCEAEAKKWRVGTGKPTYVIGHEFHLNPTPTSFSDRRDILFVGSFHGADSPNGDSVEWFLTQVMPRIKSRLGKDIKLRIVGYNPLEEWDLLTEKADDIEVLGRVESLAPFYDQSRLVVIPTRFAAGIPQKAFDAAEHAVPVVCTDLIAGQMEWTDNREALVTKVNDAETFAEHCVALYTDEKRWSSIRENMIDYMQSGAQHYDLKKSLVECLEQAFSRRPGV